MPTHLDAVALTPTDAMNRFGLPHAALLSIALLGAAGTAVAQTAPPTVVVFPLKNVRNNAQHDTLSWMFADSLYSQLAANPEAGAAYTLISMDDLRDQIIAQNVDIKSPSYDSDLWKIAGALGANRAVVGSYMVDNEMAYIEVKVYDVKTLLFDQQNKAENLKRPFPEAITAVPSVVKRIIGAVAKP